jgi:hypothetical protein
LDAFRFKAAPAAQPILEAIETLKAMNGEAAASYRKFLADFGSAVGGPGGPPADALSTRDIVHWLNSVLFGPAKKVPSRIAMLNLVCFGELVSQLVFTPGRQAPGIVFAEDWPCLFVREGKSVDENASHAEEPRRIEKRVQ